MREMSPMLRTVVYRHDETGEPVNVNKEIGLSPIDSYTLAEHLQDLAFEEGLKVVAKHGAVHLLSDDTMRILTERQERIPVEMLDRVTRSQLLSLPAMPQCFPAPAAAALAC